MKKKAVFDCNQSDVALPVLDMLNCEIVLDAEDN